MTVHWTSWVGRVPLRPGHHPILLEPSLLPWRGYSTSKRRGKPRRYLPGSRAHSVADLPLRTSFRSRRRCGRKSKALSSTVGEFRKVWPAGDSARWHSHWRTSHEEQRFEHLAPRPEGHRLFRTDPSGLAPTIPGPAGGGSGADQASHPSD